MNATTLVAGVLGGLGIGLAVGGLTGLKSHLPEVVNVAEKMLLLALVLLLMACLLLV